MNIGVLGCGDVWKKFHEPAFQCMEEVKIIAVYDLDQNRTEQAALANNARVCRNAQEVFETPEIEIVLIATPPFVHLSQVEMACQSGKNIIVEKPLAHNVEDARKIVKEIKKAGIKCFIPYWRTWNPIFEMILQLVKSGEFGKPISFIHTGFAEPFDWAEWMINTSKSGGPVYDATIHYVDLARNIFEELPKNVTYRDGAYWLDHKNIDTGFIAMEFGDNSFVQLTKMWIPKGEGWNYVRDLNHIICEKGAIFSTADKIEWTNIKGRRSWQPNDWWESMKIERIKTYRKLFAEFKNNQTIPPTEIDGLRDIEIFRAGFDSRIKGCPVTPDYFND